MNYDCGYGLSYTTFKTDNVNVKVDGENMVTTATVTNTGKAVSYTHLYLVL